MTVTAEIATTDVAVSTTGTATVSRPWLPAVTAHQFEMVWAKSTAHVVATTVMWLIVLAVITVV
jgi:hypothetical protein